MPSGGPLPRAPPLPEPAERKEASDATGAAPFSCTPKCEGCTPNFVPFKIGDQDLRGVAEVSGGRKVSPVLRDVAVGGEVWRCVLVGGGWALSVLKLGG